LSVVLPWRCASPHLLAGITAGRDHAGTKTAGTATDPAEPRRAGATDHATDHAGDHAGPAPLTTPPTTAGPRR